jgi:hypothetical protein
MVAVGEQLAAEVTGVVGDVGQDDDGLACVAVPDGVGSNGLKAA